MHAYGGFHGLLRVEVAEAEREGVQHAEPGLFREALVDELEGLAGHGAMGVSVVIEEHGGFEHAHGMLQRRSLGAGGAHLDDALTGVGDVGAFLAELAVREHLDFVLAAGKFFEVLAKLMHADGFRFAFGLHAGYLDDSGALSRRCREAGETSHEGTDGEQCGYAFHQSSS